MSDGKAGQSSLTEIECVAPKSEVTWDSEEEKKLVRKADLFLLPCIWLMYLLSYMDRTNIGNAKVAGMEEDLHLDSNRYSVSLVVFFIGYVIFEVPSNMLLAKSRPSIFLPVIMFLWGGVTMCMAAIKSYEQLVALRIVVGILESGFAPGVLLTLSSWYKRDEQAKRFGVYISAAILSGAFGGLIAGAITGNLDGVHGLRGWQWLFIVEGAATSGWSLISAFILLDFPSSSKSLSERERMIAVKRLEAEHLASTIGTEDQPELTHIQALKVSLTNWRTWTLTAGYMVIVGSSTLSYFYPTLVEGLGYTGHMTQFMTVPIYAVAFVANAITGYFCDKRPHRRAMVIALWLFSSMVFSIIVCTVYNYTARYVMLILMASALWSANALALAYSSSTFGSMPREARGISLALVNALGNTSQIYGSFLFPDSDSPKYTMGFSVISAMCFFGVIVFTYMQLFCFRAP